MVRALCFARLYNERARERTFVASIVCLSSFADESSSSSSAAAAAALQAGDDATDEAASDTDDDDDLYLAGAIRSRAQRERAKERVLERSRKCLASLGSAALDLNLKSADLQME